MSHNSNASQLTIQWMKLLFSTSLQNNELDVPFQYKALVASEHHQPDMSHCQPAQSREHCRSSIL